MGGIDLYMVSVGKPAADFKHTHVSHRDLDKLSRLLYRVGTDTRERSFHPVRHGKIYLKFAFGQKIGT